MATYVTLLRKRCQLAASCSSVREALLKRLDREEIVLGTAHGPGEIVCLYAGARPLLFGGRGDQADSVLKCKIRLSQAAADTSVVLTVGVSLQFLLVSLVAIAVFVGLSCCILRVLLDPNEAPANKRSGGIGLAVTLSAAALVGGDTLRRARREAATVMRALDETAACFAPTQPRVE